MTSVHSGDGSAGVAFAALQWRLSSLPKLDLEPGLQLSPGTEPNALEVWGKMGPKQCGQRCWSHSKHAFDHQLSNCVNGSFIGLVIGVLYLKHLPWRVLQAD